jgi:peptidyl-prolyl cis-trans isomerase C
VRLRKEILKERRISGRRDEVARLRAAAKVTIHREALDPTGDVERAPLTPVATVDGESITWRQLLPKLPTTIRTVDNRLERVEQLVDTHLLAREARRLGLDQEESLQAKMAVFRRDELTKLVREEIIAREGLDDAGVEREYQEHIENFTLPEQRKVQQIVVTTKEEAEEILAILKDPPEGVTFFTLARERSIVPHVEKTLGVLGWVTREQGHPKLSDAAFSLGPGGISEPVETEGGFHIIRVLEERPEEVVPLDDDTRQRIRERWNYNKVQAYASRLADEKYPVKLFPEVYKLNRPTTAAAEEKN